MSDSDRKGASREEAERSSKRSGVLRRGRRKREEEVASGEAAAGSGSTSVPPPKDSSKEKSKAGAEGKGSHPPPSEAGQLDDGGKVSSLLQTTGQDVKQLLAAADEATKQIREAAQTDSQGGSESQASGETDSLVGRINREVQQVLETADDAADKIREEAQAEARQIIAEARRRAESVTKTQIDRVSQMTDQITGELSAVQDRLAQLQAVYDQSIKAMNADLGAQESKVWETPQPQNGESEDTKEAEDLRARLGKRTPRKGAQEPEGISEGARLLALQQMMAGVDPEVIERRLRTEFGIEDPKPILDWMGLHGGAAQPRERKKS